MPIGPEPTAKQSLAKELRLKKKLSDDFLKWRKDYVLELRNVQCPQGSVSSREDRPTRPMVCRPNQRGRSPQTLVVMDTHRGVAEEIGRLSEISGPPGK